MAAFAADLPSFAGVSSREELLAEYRTEESKARAEALRQAFAALDAQSEDFAPSRGLEISDHELVSEPDGNTIKIRLYRPPSSELLPCVYYIHGGGMMVCSAYDPQYQTWGRLLAHQGVAVAMVEFRNSAEPTDAVPEVAPYPGGLNDCVSGVAWLSANAESLGIAPGRLIVAGESGGGNLTLASGLRLLRDRRLDLIRGLYALCPYIAGIWPLESNPSSIENNGIGGMDMHTNRFTMAYGIEEVERRNPLAFPGFATVDDVKGLVPTVIHVNEFDPLRDEGIAFYRLLLQAGVQANCRQIMGTTHGAELLWSVVPDVAVDGARSVADFCKRVTT